MQALKRFTEWYLGIPPAEPGQGTAWRLDTQIPWPAGLPPWLVLLLAIVLVVSIVWVYRRDAGATSRRARLLLIGLRLSVLGVLLLFLSRMTLSVERIGLPVVVVLIDDSASMGLEDRYGDAATEEEMRKLLLGDSDQSLTRIALAKSILSRDEAMFLKQIARDHKLRVYRFSETAVLMGRGDYLGAEEVEELVPLLAGLRPEGEQTRPGPAVRKVLNDLRGAPPSAVVILSDGISSTGEADKLSSIAELAASRYVPIFTIGIGSEEPSRDIQLYDVLVDDVAFVDDLLTFSAKLKAYGYKSQQVVVTLREQDSTTVLATKSFRAEEDGQPMSIELPFIPTSEGEFDYTLEVVPLTNETNVENNAETRHVSVRGEKIRVLLVDAQPRYEFRALKQLLEREKTVDVRVVLQDADLEFASDDRVALNHFPVQREELFEYDVVILGDVDPERFSSGVFENLRDFVLDAGGGVILVAGRMHNPHGYRGTPLEVMLPVILDRVDPSAVDQSIVVGFRPELTLDGRKGTSLFRFAESDEESLTIWNGLPELYWWFEAPELKKGSRLFAQHPTRAGSAGNMPVIAMQHYGAGKVLFHATDETWRWRYLVGDLYYGRYWIHAIRFLSRSKLLGRDRSAELTVDRSVFDRGDPIRLRLRFLDERLIPNDRDGVVVMVEKPGEVERKVELSQLPRAPTVFEGIYRSLGEGSYHAWVAAPSFKEKPPSVDFRVQAPQRELLVRSLDRAELSQVARQTHGRYFSLSEALGLPEMLPRGEPIPLETRTPIPVWNRWEILLLFAGLLLTEWLLRKRLRLL